MAQNIVAQAVSYDQYGWPVNPATGRSYTRDDLIADPSLPLPQDRVAQASIRRARAGEVAETPKPKKKTKSRSRKPSKRTFMASAVLHRLSFAGQQGETRAKATAEQVSRTNESHAVLVQANGRLDSILEVDHVSR